MGVIDKDDVENQQFHDAMLTMLDVAGRRIEALDRSMMVIRQLFFVVLGILGAGFATIAKELEFESITILLGAGSFIISGIAWVLWRLDNHYHQYLIESVRTSMILEKKLGFNKKNKLGLATNLESYRDHNVSGQLIPATIYLLPTIFGMCATLIMGLIHGIVYGPSNIIYQVSIFSTLIILFITIGFINEVKKEAIRNTSKKSTPN
ncbi:MAG: hypothetical protein HPY73_05745 [Methanomassiliicoccales archaeon]|nr:MAG: hypothetical protein HPY73_05745 [Methanomassiliicoccales archaeon]